MSCFLLVHGWLSLCLFFLWYLLPLSSPVQAPLLSHASTLLSTSHREVIPGLCFDFPHGTQPLPLPLLTPSFPIALHAAQAWDLGSSLASLLALYMQAGTENYCFFPSNISGIPLCLLITSAQTSLYFLNFCERISNWPVFLQSLPNSNVVHRCSPR